MLCSSKVQVQAAAKTVRAVAPRVRGELCFGVMRAPNTRSGPSERPYGPVSGALQHARCQRCS